MPSKVVNDEESMPPMSLRDFHQQVVQGNGHLTEKQERTVVDIINDGIKDYYEPDNLDMKTIITRKEQGMLLKMDVYDNLLYTLFGVDIGLKSLTTKFKSLNISIGGIGRTQVSDVLKAWVFRKGEEDMAREENFLHRLAGAKVR